MKTRFIAIFLILFSIFSCKDNKPAEETKAPVEVKAENPNAIKLSNYSDENWSNGVGITFKMLLTDFSKEKEELIKNGKELILADGTAVPYVGYEVAGKYIHIFLTEPAVKYSAAAEYPNIITVK